MASILPTFKTFFSRASGTEFFVSFPAIDGNLSTFLSADVSASASSLSVQHGNKFGTDQLILIGELGSEQSEILQIHSSTSPTATTITLSSSTSFAHSRGTRVTRVSFNRVELGVSTDSGGSYSVITTVNLTPSNVETYYHYGSGAVTHYYRIRYNNSNSGAFSLYSDGVIVTGYADNSVHSIKRRAMQDMGENIGDVITDQFLKESLWEGRREL